MFIRTKYWTKKANYWCSYLGKIKDWAKLSNELKTKPAQNAVKQIMQYGIQLVPSTV